MKAFSQFKVSELTYLCTIYNNLGWQKKLLTEKKYIHIFLFVFKIFTCALILLS